MRTPGKLHPSQDAFIEPDTGITMKISTASTAQAYPANAKYMRVQSSVLAYLSLDSTSAHIPVATIAATTGSTGRQSMLYPGLPQYFQLTSKTTSDKLSVAGSTAGVFIAHFYGTGA